MRMVVAWGLAAIVLAFPAVCRSADDDPSATDEKALQGEWKSVREKVGGKAMTKADLKVMDKRLTVKGNKFIVTRAVKDKLGTYDGRFEFDATQKPKAFDWTGKGPGGNAIEMQGSGKKGEKRGRESFHLTLRPSPCDNGLHATATASLDRRIRVPRAQSGCWPDHAVRDVGRL